MKIKTLFYCSIFLSVLVVLASSTVSAQVYGGRSVGATASITNNGTTTNYAFADSGPLPSGGGNVTATAPSSSITGIMGTGVLTASTSGALRSSQSVTVANDVLITVGGVTIRANRVTTNSGCICCPGADLPTCTGSTSVNLLTVTDSAGNATTVNATGAANQTVVLPNGAGTLTINEQVVGLASITVNGLRVRGPAAGVTYDIVIASSTSELECLVTAPTASPVKVSGRVTSPDGRGIYRATVSLTDDQGNVRSAVTNSSGYYTLAEVAPGTYIVGATHRTYQFSPRSVNLSEDTTVSIVSN